MAANWLGGGLSQITGQISNFTREVLTEGTEEIDDAPTELKLAKARIRELETLCISQKSELDKLKTVNDELSEKLESAELQITAISSEYRGIVEQKEVELKELKQQQNDMLEYQSRLLEASKEGKAQSDTFLGSSNIPEFEGDNHDFGDVISFQHEINRLRSDVKRLESECSHWKRVANSSGDGSARSDVAENHADLQNQIKELKQKLSDEIDEHQRELSTLQDVHSQKLATLKKKQKDEISRLKEQIADLEEHYAEDAKTDVPGVPGDRIKQLEDVNHKLSLDLDQTHAADREKQRILADLQKKIEKKDATLEQLVAENDTLKSERAAHLSEIDAFCEERQKLKLRLNEANQQIQTSARGKPGPSFLEDRELSSPLSSTPIKGEAHGSRVDDGDFDSLSSQNHDLQEKIQGLQDKLDEYELVNSDWQMEKEALEDVLVKLRQQIQEKDEQLSSVAAQDGSSDRTSELLKEIDSIKNDRDTKEKDRKEAIAEKDKAVLDLDSVRKEVRQLEQYAKEKEQEISNLSNLVESGNPDISRELEKEHELVAQLQSEKVDLESSLEELDAQHQEALAQMILTRDSLQKSNEELLVKMQQLEDDLKSAKENASEESASQEKAIELQEKMDRLQDQLLSLIKQIQLLEAEKLRRDAEANEMREREKEAALALNDLHMDKKEQEAEIARLKKQLAEKSETIGQLRRETVSMRSEVEMQKSEDHTDSVPGADDKSQSTIIDLQSKISDLEEMQREQMLKSKEEIESLNRDLQRAEENLRKTTQQYEGSLEILNSSLQSNAVTFEEFNQSLQQVVTRKDEEITSLQTTVETEKKSILDLENKLTTAQTGIKELADLKKGTDEDVQSLRHEFAKVVQEKESLESEVKSQTTELEQSVEENHQLQTAIEGLTKQLQVVQAEQTRKGESNAQLGEEMQELENKIGELEEEVSKRDAQVAKFNDEIASLQQVNTEQAQVVSRSKESIQALEKQIELLRQAAKQDSSCDSNSNHSDDNRGMQNGIVEQHQQNGDIHEDDGLHEKKITDLEKAVAEKDKVITALNDTNSSMLKLLEERSLLDIHQLQTQIKGLQVEKEQILSILNEKSRENSKMKSENHKLMNVVSQQKGALSKLQEDNRGLSTSQTDNVDSPNQEMTKEAIKKLSQIIRDKDMEIEALGQKTQTLLQVLQESSQDGAHMATVMQERDNLSKQIVAFQNDREQIIAALNAKHQEAVAYHAEVQRLNAVVSKETEKQEKIQQEYSNLVQQYEDKQQTLLKTQNELVNYKQKYVEVDNRYKEILLKAKISDKSQSSNIGHSESPGPETPRIMDQTQTLPPNCDSNAQNRELEDLKAIIHSQEIAFSEKDKLICDKENVIQERDRVIMFKDRQLSEKDRETNELRTKLGRVEESLRSHESESQSYKKQYENASFTLQGIQNELTDTKKERDQLNETNSVLQQEISVVRDANNRLSMSVHDKDFEMNALKDKVNTLTKIVQEAGEGEKGEMDRLMKETEEVQQQVQMYKQDRDQAFLALQQQQNENQQLRNEIQKLHEKQEKLMRELERLRSHLLQIEDGYTQEALLAEEREKELRNRLASAEERALSSSSAVENVNLQASAQVESLQLQVHQLSEQRDNAVMQLASVQETSNQYATSLANLQMVLEQFQMEKEQQQAAEVEKLQKVLNQKEQEVRDLKDEMHQMQMQLDDTTDALEAAQRLSEQLDKKEEMIAALREEVQLRETELKKSEEEIQKLSTSKEGKVDKVIVKNLILGYFHTPANKRKEALQVVGQVLSFTPTEMREIDGGETGGWFGLFRRAAASPTPPTTPQKQSFNNSFSQLFVSFLEKESSPQPELRLPAEKMVREQQERQQQQKNKPAFNPFAAPAMQAPAAQPVGDQSDDHLLMKPLSSSLPVFQPFASTERTLTPPSVMAGQSSEGASANSSGRSTPASSGAILRDVLLQQ